MSDHAVVIGIETYPGLDHLEGPCNDAEAICDWLASPQGWGLDGGNLRRSLTTDYEPQDEDDLTGIRPQFDDLSLLFIDLIDRAMNEDRVGERLFLYAAGHGIADSQSMKDVAVLTANARQNMPLHVMLTFYADWFRRKAAFDEIILVMDCCRDVSPMVPLVRPMLLDVSPHARAGRVKTFHAFATEWGHVAREREIAGRKRGIFTATLLDALHNQAPNRHNRVTGSLIASYVRDKIKSFAGDKDIRPPQIDAPPDRDVLFARRDVAPTVPVAFSASAAVLNAELVIFDGQLQEIHRRPVTEAAFTVPLPAGYHTWTVVGSNQLVPFEVPAHETIAL